MTERSNHNILADCLDRIEQSGESIQQAVSHYPDHAEELVGLLRTFETLRTIDVIYPEPEFKAASRARLLNQIIASEKTSQPVPVTKPAPLRLIGRKHTRPRRFAMKWLIVIGLIISTIGGGGGAAIAAADALPGDMLYPVKTSLQDLELTFSDDVHDIDLLLGNLLGNLDEMQQLAALERYADILVGLEEYEENLKALIRKRDRISYEDAGSEQSMNNRIQQQLEIHAHLLQQLELQTQNQLRLQEKFQQAIQLTEQGYTYGPNDGGKPDEPGTPNGPGPGEPQGTQQGPNKPEDPGSGGGQGEQGNPDPGNEPGSGGQGDHGAGNQNQSGQGEGSSGSGQGGKP